MKKLLVVTALSFGISSYMCTTDATLEPSPSMEESVDAATLKDIIYDAFDKYVTRNNPPLEHNPTWQQKMANRNLNGLLEVFFETLGDRPYQNVSSLQKTTSKLDSKVETLDKTVAGLQDDIKLLRKQIAENAANVAKMKK